MKINKKHKSKGRIDPSRNTRSDTRNRGPINATKPAQNLVTKTNTNQEAQRDMQDEDRAEGGQAQFGRRHGSAEPGLSPIVVNSIPVPAGMAGMPRTGTWTGTEDHQSRTGSNTGQYRPIPVIPAEMPIPAISIPVQSRWLNRALCQALV